jgi:hypothetical protein
MQLCGWWSPIPDVVVNFTRFWFCCTFRNFIYSRRGGSNSRGGSPHVTIRVGARPIGAPLVNALQQSRPHDPVLFDGGVDDLSGEFVGFREQWMHDAPRVLEQKQTEETNDLSMLISGWPVETELYVGFPFVAFLSSCSNSSDV